MNNSTQRFSIYMPNGYKKTLYYKPDDNKVELVNNYILKFWEDYFNSHWIYFGKKDEFHKSFEDKTKSVLNRCGTFLLLGEFKNGMILSSDKVNKIYKNEIVVSCTASNTQDLFYSDKSDEDYDIQVNGSNTILNNEVLLNNIELEDLQINKSDKPDKRIKKRKTYSQTKQYKMKNLFSSEDIYRNELYKLKNSDFDSSEFTVNKKFENEEDLNKWSNKPFRNIFGENVYDVKPKLYKGVKGVINPSLPYSTTWCYVYTDNSFNYNNYEYIIDDCVQQYKGIETITKKGDKDIYYPMDNILILEQNGKKYFYDMNIDRIDEKFIKIKL